MVPATPSQSTIIDDIRSSCSSLCERSVIIIDDTAINTFLITINEQDWSDARSSPGVRLPLRFDSEVEELNLVCTLALLNFLSGYRTALKQRTGRGAADNILALVLASHLGPSDEADSSPLTATGMASCDINRIANLMNVRTHVEKDHPTLGSAVKVGEKDEEVFEILGLIVTALNETGRVLLNQSKRNLGEWVRDTLIETQGHAGPMLEKIISTFPPFQDAYVVDGSHVYIYKKALFLLASVSRTFSSSDRTKPSFPLPDLSSLPIFADNVVPTMLLHHSILDTSRSIDPAITHSALETNKLLSNDSATRLRAAAVVACRRIVERVNAGEVDLARRGDERDWLKDMTEVDLDAYLWTVAKKGALRDVERIAERGTYMY